MCLNKTPKVFLVSLFCFFITSVAFSQVVDITKTVGSSGKKITLSSGGSTVEINKTGTVQTETVAPVTVVESQAIATTDVQPVVVATKAATSETIAIDENDRTETIDCNGETVVVNGNGNFLSIIGTCSSVNINGNENNITVRAATPGIYVMGNDNNVSWKAVGGLVPEISNPGSRNTITEIQ